MRMRRCSNASIEAKWMNICYKGRRSIYFHLIHSFMWHRKWINFIAESRPNVALLWSYTFRVIVFRDFFFFLLPEQIQKYKVVKILVYFPHFDVAVAQILAVCRFHLCTHWGKDIAEFRSRLCPVQLFASRVSSITALVIDPSSGSSIGIPANSLQLAKNGDIYSGFLWIFSLNPS